MKLSIIALLGVFLIVGINASSVSSDEDAEQSPDVYGILGKLECKLCKEAMKLVAKEVNKDSAKNEIIKALDKACTIIPEKKLRGKCRDAIKNHGDEIADAIVGNMASDFICKILEFC